jgi:simple sugar transport system permease protein
LVRRQSGNLILIAILILCFALFSILVPNRFLAIGNLQAMAFQLPELGLLALGMMIAMVSGGINLSLISNANLFGVITMLLFTHFTKGAVNSAVPWYQTLLAVLAGFLAAMSVGLLNGLIISYVGVPPILATLGTMTLVSGINVLLTRGYTFGGVPKTILALGNEMLLGIPIPLLIFLGGAALLALLMRRTALGYSIYMLGSNAEVTRFSGLNNERVTIQVYMISSLFAVLSAAIMMGRFNSAKADYGESYLLVTVLAAVLGGVNPAGGFGGVLGIVLALVILQLVGNGFNLLMVDPNLALVVWGAILIATMATRLLSESVVSQRLRSRLRG